MNNRIEPTISFPENMDDAPGAEDYELSDAQIEERERARQKGRDFALAWMFVIYFAMGYGFTSLFGWIFG